MDDGPAGHAMTEIALALAMSFFCLLVLALVTMGTPSAPADSRIEALAAAPAGGAAEPLAPTDRLVVFHRGRFLDAERRPLDLTMLNENGRLVLAVDPGLPLAEVLAARRRLDRPDLVVTPLDPAWLAALGPGAGR